MNLILARFVLFVFLITNTPLKCVVRIPVLLNHFAKHYPNNHSYDFVEFIKLHYLTDTPHHHDDSSGNHENLPLKSPSDFSLTGFFINSHETSDFFLKTWNIWIETSNCNWETIYFIPFQLVFAIFHPPKPVV